MKEVIIYTDGSCLKNPGPGGWAAILVLKGTDHRREISGGFRKTTNNRMEILAAIEGLSALKEPCAVQLFSDSQYLCKAITANWLRSWRAKNWIKSDGKPVLNVDLWLRLLPLLEKHNVKMNWLRGHSGHSENERCDSMAKNKAQEADLPVDKEFEDGKQNK